MALPGTTAPRQGLWARRGTMLPANTLQALAAFPRFAGRLRKGTGDGSCVCRELKPAQNHFSAWTHRDPSLHLLWGTGRCK